MSAEHSDANEALNASILDAKKSELSFSDKREVADYEPTDDEIARATSLLQHNAARIAPDHMDALVAAKLVGALGEGKLKRTAEGYNNWLLIEAYVLQGKDPNIIHGKLLGM